MLFDQLTPGAGMRLKCARRKMDVRAAGKCRESHADGFMALEHANVREIGNYLPAPDQKLLDGVLHNPGWDGYR